MPRLASDGRPPQRAAGLSFSDEACARVVAAACRPPSDLSVPITQWSAALLGAVLRADGLLVSDRSVARILREADLQPHRQSMWMTSQDDDFREKRDDVLGVYYRTPDREHVICLDEMTGIQALERAHPDLPMAAGRPVRREFEYVRHGTQCLMGAYDVRRGKLFGFVADKRGTEAFLALLEHVDACYPEGKGHLVCDNLAEHVGDEVAEWLEDHPRWTLHCTPKHASWLNQIECAFSLVARHVVRRGSFRSKEELRLALEAYMLWYNEHGQPFHWTYRPKSWDQKPAQTSGGRH